LLEPVVGIKNACDLPGISRATLYRKRNPKPKPEGPREAPAVPPNALSPDERAGLLAILDSARFAGKAPRQVWAALLDEGTCLASISTMYRILRAARQVRERRAQARHSAKVKPELVAYAPNEVWSWDITKLQGPAPGGLFNNAS
jgi:putative transposase